MGLRSTASRALRWLSVKAAGGWAPSDLERFFGPARRNSKSDHTVTPETAMQVTVVFAVVLRIAYGVAQVPWKVFKDRPDGRGRDEFKDHPLYRLLHLQPNEWTTSFSFRVTLMLHLLLAGNFYCFVNRVSGRIVELIPFEPGKIKVERRRDLSLRYYARGDDGIDREIPPEAMWHVRGPSWNGWGGLEPVRLAREAIGLAMATELTQQDLQKRGAKMPGVLALEGNLTDLQYEGLAKWLKGNALVAYDELGVILVDRQAKFHSIAMSGVDAQTLETRKFQVEEICRQWLLMPVMIGHPADMAARAAMEQIFIAHVVHTLDPLMVCVEQSAQIALFDPERDAGVVNELVRAGLMRGDMKAQAEWLAKAVGQGSTGPGQSWATPNDARDVIGWNPIEGGDVLTSGPQNVSGAKPPAADPLKDA